MHLMKVQLRFPFVFRNMQADWEAHSFGTDRKCSWNSSSALALTAAQQ